jgi:hypothetical protein
MNLMRIKKRIKVEVVAATEVSRVVLYFEREVSYMEWIANNWFILLIIAVFAGMHLFGYGCCGHSKHKKKDGHDDNVGNADVGPDGEKPKKAGHGCCG